MGKSLTIEVYSMTLFDQSTPKSIEDINGYFLNNKRMDLIKELADYLNQFKEAKDRGNDVAMKLAQMGVTRLNVLRKSIL